MKNPQYSPAELEQIRQVANGSFKGNLPQFLSNLGFSADYIASKVGSMIGGPLGEIAGGVASNLSRRALKATGKNVAENSAMDAATRARNLVAMGNRGGVSDAVTNAGAQPGVRRIFNSLSALQNSGVAQSPNLLQQLQQSGAQFPYPPSSN